MSITIKFKKELIDIKNKSKDLTSSVAMCKRIQKIRKQLVLTIFRSARTKYATEEHEYKAIGKFYRGMFRKVAYNDHRPRKDRLFDDTEQEILVNRQGTRRLWLLKGVETEGDTGAFGY